MAKCGVKWYGHETDGWLSVSQAKDIPPIKHDFILMRPDWADVLSREWVAKREGAYKLFNRLTLVAQPAMNATELHVNDRYPYTVVTVLTPDKVVLTPLSPVWVEGRVEGFALHVPEDPSELDYVTVSRRKDGYWHEVGKSADASPRFFLGEAQYYVNRDN